MGSDRDTANKEALQRIRQAQEVAAIELSLADWALECLPEELGNPTVLQSLDLSGCVQLQHLQPLAGLTALQSLNLRACWHVQHLQPLAGLTALQSLNLCAWVQLQDLQPLAGLTALRSLI